MQPAIYSASEAADCYYSVSEMAIAIGSTSRTANATYSTPSRRLLSIASREGTSAFYSIQAAILTKHSLNENAIYGISDTAVRHP